MNLKDLRREYASRALDERRADPDPIAQFLVWFDEALSAEIKDANAMSLATATRQGEPSARIVLLKEVDDRGFMFFTHYESAKGKELTSNPRASLVFFWAELERQVRITGAVTRVSREVSEAYFASRPIESQLSASLAIQSTPIRDRMLLEQLFEEAKSRYGATVPCPPNWGGFHVAAEKIEFWQGRPGRLHDRLLYTRAADGSWARTRLTP
jgi:pyridoxamine 5'-phosphate oxidase